MGSNNNESSSRYAPTRGTKASVIPKQREHVSTMVGKTMARAIGKAGKSLAKVAGDHKNKAKAAIINN
ncbi:hypothetical protein AAHA92_20702 [Salvia divinorum]|uniref:Uncharacterized protein n=1 Tax=Salvia divinorum TaxID=28513 RepID=A0ABD1GI21_SALDI